MSSTNPKRAVERYDLIKALGRVPSWWRLRARRSWLQSFASIMAMDISEAAEMLRDVYSADALQQMAEQRANPLALLIAKLPRRDGDRL